MKRFIKDITAGCLILTAALAASCMDEEWTVKSEVPFQMDEEGRTVAVELPFSLPKRMTATVVTRANGEEVQMEDATLSGIHLAVFKDNGGAPENDELILWKLYNRKDNPDEGGSGFWEDTGHGPDTANDGLLRFYAPTGKVYIYLLANTKGTLFDFYKVGDDYVADDENIKMTNRADFFHIIQPKWKENLVPTDGILPMTGMADNKDGRCFIGIPVTQTGEKDKGSIWYQKDGTEEWTEISPNMDEEEHSFMLRRMVSKVTFNIKTGTPDNDKGATIKFTPRNYTFRHVARYVPAPPNTAPDEYWPEAMKAIPVVDSETHIFGTQSPNSFTVYLPENIRGHTPLPTGQSAFTYAMRDKVVKTDTHKNTYEEADDIPGGSLYANDHKGHYKFRHAPSGSTYVEIAGHYEKQKNGKVTESGDTRYMIHLGDFSQKGNLTEGKGYDNFNLIRDHHYTFNVTIKGIDDIETEVHSGDEANEPNPGVEGIIFKEGAQLRLDAHYETVEMLFNKDAMQVAAPDNPDGAKVPGIYLYTETPFGNMFGTYIFPQDGNTGQFYNEQGTPIPFEDAAPYFEWVSFRKQNEKNALAPYADSNGEIKAISIFKALDDFWSNARNSSTGYKEYYTCFVDEYYYAKNPHQPTRVPQVHEFVNKPDRTFSLASDVKYSADGKSGIANAVYVLKQRSIATFYDINNPIGGIDFIYGLETVDELEGSDLKMEDYGGENNGEDSPQKTGIGEGYKNTKEDLGISSDNGKSGKHVNWEKNGYLLDGDGGAYLPKPANRLNMIEGRYACLTRNRDFNGDGEISGDELRWYTPSLDQVLGIWVGEPGLPSAESALYTNDTQNLSTDKKFDSNSQYPIFTSSEQKGRVVWGEEGCSFGANSNASEIRGRVRAVRTLSAKEAKEKDYKETPDPFYQYEENTGTITLYLNSAALRDEAVKGRELAPHHERDIDINRPYKKFQIAKHPYVEKKVSTFECPGHVLHDGDPLTVTWWQLQTGNAENAKRSTDRMLSNYTQETGGTDKDSWRLPNQRELALMVMVTDLSAYHTDDLTGAEYNDCKTTEIKADCSYLFFQHKWKHSAASTNLYLHCRTSFSNSKFFGNHAGQTSGWFRPHGYFYTTVSKIITMSSGDSDGISGYLGVRDIE